MARRRHHHWQRRNNFHGRGRRRGWKAAQAHLLLSLSPSRSSIMMEVRSFIEMIDAKSPPKVAEAAAAAMAAALASASIVNDYPGRAIQGHSLSRGRALRRYDIPSLLCASLSACFQPEACSLTRTEHSSLSTPLFPWPPRMAHPSGMHIVIKWIGREDERKAGTDADGAFFPPRPPKRATMWARYNVMGVIRKEKEGLN